MGPEEDLARFARARPHREHDFGRRPDAEGASLIAEISDPVAGYVFVLDSVNKVAHRIKVQPPPERSAGVRRAAAIAPGTTGDPGSIDWAPNTVRGVLFPNAPVRVIQRMQPKTSEGPGTNLLMRLMLSLIHHEHQNHCFSG